MDFTYDETKKMLYGSYKKLKSYYYYDKTLLFVKKKLAEFEYNDELFERALDELANALVSEDLGYFEKLIALVDFRVFPKSLISKCENPHIIAGTVDHQKNIAKINFFIDAPVELLILDCLWTLCLSKIGRKKYGINACSYAGMFKPSVFYSEQDSLFRGIDWDSNRCFEPYFENYSRWQKDAFSSLRKGIKADDQLMFSLDLKSFYYSVCFEFDSLNILLDNDPRLGEIAFISKIEEKLFAFYTELIRKYKMGIDIQNGATIFPIGLLSPIFLREMYLNEFDRDIRLTLNPIYYGRYVDDMIVVIPAKLVGKQASPDLICDFLCSQGLITKKLHARDDAYIFRKYETVAIQRSKINCFYFEKGESNILIEIAEKQIRSNSSEANLLPDLDIIQSRFNDNAYFINSIGGSTKIRDIGILQSNNYAVSRNITQMKQLLKNTHIEESDKKIIKEFIRELLNFYKGSSAIEFMGSWVSVFELILQVKVLSSEKQKRDPFAKEFYGNILYYINQTLSFDMIDAGEIYAKKKATLYSRIKRDLRDRLRISIALAMALDYSWEATSPSIKKNLDMAKKFRKSNIFNHNLVFFPLINYLPFSQIEECSLIQIKEEPWDDWSNLTLDKQRLLLSPRFIHLDEFFIYSFMESTLNEKSRTNRQQEIESVWNRYIRLNNVTRFAPESILRSPPNCSQGKNANVVNLEIRNASSPTYRVGLANTLVTEEAALHYLLDPAYQMSFHNKVKLFQMANSAVRESADFIAFPELFVPIVWLKEIAKFAQKNSVSIIAGLRYIRKASRAFNYTTIIQPCLQKKYRNVIALFREKNFYAPEERESLWKLGYNTFNPATPTYFVVNDSELSYSTILCYEFTDIGARAALKGKVDVLFVPQLNKDTNYFSSIVESSSRDLHCFIVQANTPKYGDSRITGPYDTIHKNIVQIKGGINDAIIIGELNIAALKEARRSYVANHQYVYDQCFSCRKLKSPKNDALFDACKTCKKHLNKQFIKDLPANYP